LAQEDKWKNSPVRKLFYLTVLGWIILAIIFGIFDLQISIAVVDQNNPFGLFGADYGEGPGYGIIAVALVVLIGSAFSDIKKQKIGAFILGAFSLIVLFLGILLDSEDLILYGGFISISIFIFTSLTYEKDWRNYKNLALIILLLAVINPLLFVNITKPLCGRVRFRDLTVQGYFEYTPWFLPPGPYLHNLSFPSGHTAMGWMFLPLLIPLRTKNRSFKITGTFLIMGWGLFVGVSRIIIGAHYASDVLFSTGVAFIVVILLYKKFYLQ